MQRMCQNIRKAMVKDYLLLICRSRFPDRLLPTESDDVKPLDLHFLLVCHSACWTYSAVIIAVPLLSFVEYRTSLSGCDPWTKPVDLDCKSC